MARTKLACPVCGGRQNVKHRPSGDYKLTSCKICGFVWDQGTKTENLDLYKEHYFVNDDPKGGYSNYFEGMKINRKTFADRLKKIEKLAGKRGKLLDVGCALGECLLEAKRLGWKDAEGVEASRYAYLYAKKRGLKVKHGTLTNKFPAGSYDVVTYQDVIEHIPNPVAELKRARRVLKKKGLIYIVTPNIGGLWSKILGEHWYHYKPGEHLNYFSISSSRRALSEAGFSEINVHRTYHILSVEYILNRLKVYSPKIFGNLLRIVKLTSLKNIPVKAFTGELEAWGVKN